MTSKIRRTIITIILVAVMLLIVRLGGAFGLFPKGGGITDGIFFLQATLYQWGKNIAPERSSTNDELAYDNERLKSLLAALIIEKAEYELLKKENMALKEQIRYSDEFDLNSLHARIIGTENSMYNNTLVINKGKADGVTENLAVFVEDGIMIGKIVDAKENSAVILLLNDNNSKLATTILNLERTICITEGELGISLKMNLIPLNEEVKIHDIVTTSGLEENIPKGLVVGTVTSIEETSSELFKSATVVAPVDYYQYTIVSVILPQN